MLVFGKISDFGGLEAGIHDRRLRVEMTRSETPAKPALSNRNIEICHREMMF